MSINLTYLKYFFDAARLGSLSASSRANFVTQSAVSQGVLKLEQHFGKKLLTHRRNAIKLTDEGVRLFQNSARLFRLCDEVRQSVTGEEGNFGNLEFACYYSVAVSLLPQPIALFQERAPNVKLHFVTGRPEIVLKELKEGRVELGILSDQNDFSTFDHEPIHQGYFRIYESIQRPDKLHIEKCIFSGLRPEVYSLKEQYLKNYKKTLETHMDVNSWEVLVNLVLSNVGVGLFPDYLAEVPYRKALLRPSNLRYKPIPYTLSAVWTKGEELSNNAKTFLHCIREAYRTL